MIKNNLSRRDNIYSGHYEHTFQMLEIKKLELEEDFLLPPMGSVGYEL